MTVVAPTTGLAADIAIFDPNTIRDRVTFTQPDAPSEGMNFVIVNGGIVIEDGSITAPHPARCCAGPAIVKGLEIRHC